MLKKTQDYLSKRESQIMSIIYKKVKASVSEVQDELPDKVSYSTVRALLGILVDKGLLLYESVNKKYIYFLATPKENAEKFAIKDLINTFYNDSVEKAVVALLEYDKESLSDDVLDRLMDLINSRKDDQED
ncbi:MAG: CopY family transcriptional regulator [Firmicutes bacterium HGW-Firmicutes-1]|jgi:predicted transcriptional regulator|nr:MAG: CopY family transcriptional regulator [Firmicutes bacterium HGW-Firmicutes-1]